MTSRAVHGRRLAAINRASALLTYDNLSGRVQAVAHSATSVTSCGVPGAAVASRHSSPQSGFARTGGDHLRKAAVPNRVESPSSCRALADRTNYAGHGA